jgi:Asp-tRNA(Asn)/Glu-tRNA(Gln) amidotransferase A subunit family amidase
MRIFKLLISCLLIGISLFSCNPPETTVSIELDELTVAPIHDAYTNGLYTSEQLVQAYLDRIDSLNDTINALTTINREALVTAKQLDEEFSKTGKLRPLHGIPIIVKDNINTKGLATTAGALALADFIPAEDAFIIKKLVVAGAIILAKSNMAEWAFSPMHSESSTAGTTRNPYNLDFVPAGSSGGTGAAIAANLCTIGLGTDTGNSIRDLLLTMLWWVFAPHSAW